MNVSEEEGLSQGFESSTFPNMGVEVWWGGEAHGEQHWLYCMLNIIQKMFQALY